MTSPCPQRSRSALTRTGALAVVFGIALAPTAAYAQESAPTTVRALIAGDGSVSSVERLPDGEAPAKEDIPVTLDISQSAEGDVTTTNYTVENTSTQTKTVEYVDVDGAPQTVEQEVSLPLVAQLAVRLPASRTDVEAFGARVTKLADGSTELVWSLVLFNPIGAPTADVSFSAKGKGEPLARLETAAVLPNSTPGLSATAQAANATINGNGILNTVATGANEGLVKLSEGVGKLIDGLDKLQAGAVKLNSGLVTAGDGAEQLAVGGVKAKDGAAKLADGAGKVNDGAGKIAAGAGAVSDGTQKVAAGAGALADGADKVAAGAGALGDGAVRVDAGVGAISAGLDKASAGGQLLADGTAKLAPGAAAVAAGADSLSDGLALISGGLNQLSGVAGLPAALAGAEQLAAGVDQLRAGVGDASTPGTILNGLAQVNGGLGALLDDPNTTAVEGLPAAKGGIDQIKGAIDGPILGGLGTPTTEDTIRFAVEQVRAGLADGSEAGGGIDQLVTLVKSARAGIFPACAPAGPSANPITPCEAANTAVYALDHPVGAGGANDAGGLKQRSAAGAAGLQAAGTGLTGIVNGLSSTDADRPGVSQGLAAISGKPSTSSTQATGLSKAIEGVQALKAGVGGFDSDGNGTIDKGLIPGTNQIAGGLDGVSAGLDSLVTGLTSAVTGVTQLAAGAGSAVTGSVSLAAGSEQVATGAAALAAGAGSLNGGLAQLYTGSQELKVGTTALAKGAGDLSTGAGSLATGADTLATGAGSLATGAGTLATGAGSLADGSGTLATGAGSLATGANTLAPGAAELAAGAGKLASGSGDLAAGTPALATGAKDLSAGVAQIADGNRKLADGLPAAVDGSGAIAEGLTAVLEGEKAVGVGLGDVRTKAVEVLQSQFKQGTTLARQQLAGLDAASAMIDSTPGAATTSWVLTQSKGDISADLVSSESNTGRNVALAAGGAVLLLAGVAGGFVSGRRAGV